MATRAPGLAGAFRRRAAAPAAPAPLSGDPASPAADATAAPRKRRIEAIDFARGIAIALMILSHGVKGLLDFPQFPDWGLVPVHAITKFSSSLFILVFGIAVAVAYAPHVRTESWPRRRNRMLWRGVVILFWYKVLTVVEMAPRHEPETVVAALLYVTFPVFVEILGFYGLALLWLPLVLPLWTRLPLAAQLAVPPSLAALSWWLYHHFHFWGVPQIQALLVEHESYYTWGQLARAPLVFAGLILGALVLAWRTQRRSRLLPVALFAATSAALSAAFLGVAGSRLDEEMLAIAHNAGKHPPELAFMLYSLAGAFALLALAFLGGNRLARIARPITAIGRNALHAFIAHVLVLCLLYRWQLGYFRTVDYEKALELTSIMFVATWLWIEVVEAIRRLRRARGRHARRRSARGSRAPAEPALSS